MSIGVKGLAVKGIKDVIHEQTEPINTWFREDLSRRNTLLIVGSLFFDLINLVGMYRFARYGTTYRIVMAVAVFFAVREFCIWVFQSEPPQGYAWGYPGVMSIFVPYGETYDFFYSGSVGVCMFNFLEFQAVGWTSWSIISIFTLVYQCFMHIALRSHYTMDIISGIVFAHYFWIISEKYSYLVDWHLFGIPLGKRQSKDRDLTDE